MNSLKTLEAFHSRTCQKTQFTTALNVQFFLISFITALRSPCMDVYKTVLAK